MRRAPSLLIQLLLVAGAAALTWAFATSRWSVFAWSLPHSYNIDALEFLARLQAGKETGLHFLVTARIDRLGAPFGADWIAYPMPDAAMFMLCGYAARIVGLMAASNLALVIAHVLAALSFYACSRWLRHARLWALVGALLFSASFFNFFRSLQHYSFTLSYVVPLILLSCWLVGASTRLDRRHQGGIWLCGITAVCVGMGNPYYAFLFLQLMALGLAYQLVTRRRPGNLVVGVGAILLCIAATLLANLHPLLARPAEAAEVLSLHRNYAGTELYALQPIQLLIPPPFHRLSALAELGRRYAHETSLRGELFAPYLGLIALAAVLALVLEFALALARGRGSLRPAYAPTIGWILLFGTVGGINGWFGFVGLDLFRATNRYSVFILTVALLYLTSRLSRVTRHQPVWRYPLAIAICGVALWDQMPPRPSKHDLSLLSERVAADATFARSLEQALPRGSSVFQLPAVPFPEQAPILGMTDYEEFRPYLHSSSLRFSYGMYVDTSAAKWTRWIERQPAADVVAELQRAGFAAVIIDHRAYADHGAKLITALLGAGARPLTASADGMLTSLRLQPAATPTSPNLDDPRLNEPWDPTTGPGSAVYLESGWYGLERANGRTWRWARQTASLLVWQEGETRPLRFQFGATSLQPGTLRVRCNGRLVYTGELKPGVGGAREFVVTLNPGRNRLEWKFSEPATMPSNTDRRLLAFDLQNLTVGEK